MIKTVKGGFIVTSESGKKLSRVYKSRKAAEQRLREIEFFKNKGKNA